MATNTRAGNRRGNRAASSRKTKRAGGSPDGGVTSTVRNKPVATAAAVGGALAAGIFLWSRRNRISDQIGDLADRIHDWREAMQSNGAFAANDTNSEESSNSTPTSRPAKKRSQVQIAEEALTLKEIGQTG